ncbi:MAG: DUF6359 domain-containing protein [Muribaculum sp.]|nr:DUF6359 domain-containing protein [Muribaculum sp.]
MKKFLLSLAALATATAGFAQATGTLEKPLTVDEFLAQGIPDAAVADTYVQGYIVGYVSGQTLSTGARFEIGEDVVNTNLLLAASSSEDMYQKCVVVQLPSGDVRNALGLQAHPENIYHQVILKGSHEKYFGANGLKSVTQYQWVGDAPVVEEITTLGSADAPLTVTELLTHATVGTQYAYVTGYIVGCVKKNAMSIDDAVFSATDSPSNSNFLLAASADCKDVAQCLTVQVSDYDVRDELCLEKAPGNLGKQVTIYGTYEPYFGVKGVKGVAKFSFGDKLEEGGSGNNPAGGAIYSGLLENQSECDWTFDNIQISDPLTYVFSWKSYNNAYYLNASAFMNSTNYAAEAIAYSPVIDLAGYSDVTVNFDHAAKFQNNPDVRKEVTFVVREEGATEWSALEIPTYPTAGTWNFVNSGDIDMKAYDGKKVQIGFRYESSAQGADTWEFKNVEVKGTKTSGVEAIDVEGAEAIYFDLQGMKVANPENGLYIKVVNGKASKVLVRK